MKRRLRPVLAAGVTAAVIAVGARAAVVAPPWSGSPLPTAGRASAGIALAEWRTADNRRTCRPMAFASVGPAGRSATARRANFSGGWAVAFDLPGVRSAFGVAGAGVEGTGADTEGWPSRQVWSDGSSAGWGPEGGTGSSILAYVHAAGQRCLYNVWSRLGTAHLQQLVANLRFVAGT